MASLGPIVGGRCFANVMLPNDSHAHYLSRSATSDLRPPEFERIETPTVGDRA
jgi:hypothetical protein